MVTKTCIVCGQAFEVHKSRKNKAKYCSYQCYWSNLHNYEYSEERNRKISIANSGANCNFYIDGRSKDSERRDWIKNRGQIKKRSSNLNGSHTYGDWMTLKKQHNFTCLCCGLKEPEIKLTEDHIIPLSKGGSNNIENIQPLCRSCNAKKYTKIIDYSNN